MNAQAPLSHLEARVLEILRTSPRSFVVRNDRGGAALIYYPEGQTLREEFGVGVLRSLVARGYLREDLSLVKRCPRCGGQYRRRNLVPSPASLALDPDFDPCPDLFHPSNSKETLR